MISKFLTVLDKFCFRPFMIDRFKTKLNNLIDKPFGFKYEIKNQELHIIRNSNNEETEKIAVVDKDNRNLIDNSENQKLSHDEIEKLKKKQDISGNVTLFEIKRKF